VAYIAAEFWYREEREENAMSEAVGKFCKLWPEELGVIAEADGKLRAPLRPVDASRPMEVTTQELLASGCSAICRRRCVERRIW